MAGKIKVLVVDDSALVRKFMTEVLESDSNIKVIAQAVDPIFAMQKMEKEMPDVITLDIEMPRMDGITFLKKIMQENPIPVVICSSLTKKGADVSVKALQYGAVDIITKPEVGVKGFLEESSIRIIDAVKAASKARLKNLKNSSGVKVGSLEVGADKTSAKRMGVIDVSPKHSADIVLSKSSAVNIETTEKIIAIGASTGGTQALRNVLSNMPFDAPGILIVQHMPEQFTKAFAENLNKISQITVKEASNNDRLTPGVALVSPGNKHMLLKRSGTQYHVELVEGSLVNRHRPSVDVLFRSVARYAGKNAVGCILTGMGADGAVGLKEMRESGARTFSQSESTCVVYGMPKEAWEMGAAEAQVDLDIVPYTLLNASKGSSI